MEEKKLYAGYPLYAIDPMDHVRLRPNLYFEDCFKENNLNSLVYGALCHAIDEYFDNNCSEIIISAQSNSMYVKYNAGMSLEKSWDLTKAECIMTKIGACSNEKKHLEVGDEFCRVGMTVINAVSDRCEVKTVWNKKYAHFIFEKGKTVFKDISETDLSEEFTTISFEINSGIFDNFTFDQNDLQVKITDLKKRLTDLKIELLN